MKKEYIYIIIGLIAVWYFFIRKTKPLPPVTKNLDSTITS